MHSTNPRQVDRRVNPDLANIISKCLEPNPHHRYQDAEQLHRDLRLHLNHRSPAIAKHSAPAERVRKFFRRHPKLSSVGSLTIISLLIMTLLTWSLISRSARLAKADALQQSNRFLDQASSDQLRLSVISDDQTRMETISGQSRRLLGSFAASSAPKLHSSRRYQLLPASQQGLESSAARDLHFWLAESLRRQAAWTLDETVRTGLLDDAVQENQSAREFLEPGTSLKSLNLQYALLLRDRGESELANQLLQKSLHQESVLPEDHLMSAWLLQFDRPSLQLAEQAIEKSPLNFTAWIVAGNIFLTLDRPKRANDCYAVATSLAPDQPRAHYFLARSEMDQGNFEEAVLSFDKAWKLDPDNDAILLNRGLALTAVGRLAEAEQAFSAAIDLGSRFTRAWYLRAGVRRRLENQSGADRDMKIFLETEPEDATSFLMRGAIYAQSSPQKAIADFRSALKLNPRSTDTLQNLAYVYSEVLKDLPNAIRMMDQLIELAPRDANQIATRGVLYARAENLEMAYKDAATALELGADDAETCYRVAGIYAQTSETKPQDADRAFQLISQAILDKPQLILKFMASDPDIQPLKSLDPWQKLVVSIRQLKQLANVENSAENGHLPAKPQENDAKN